MFCCFQVHSKFLKVTLLENASEKWVFRPGRLLSLLGADILNQTFYHNLKGLFFYCIPVLNLKQIYALPCGWHGDRNKALIISSALETTVVWRTADNMINESWHPAALFFVVSVIKELKEYCLQASAKSYQHLHGSPK